MLESIFRELILDHYRRPKNKGVLEDPTVTVATRLRTWTVTSCRSNSRTKLPIRAAVAPALKPLAGATRSGAAPDRSGRF